jgi:hypothetical protein
MRGDLKSDYVKNGIFLEPGAQNPKPALRLFLVLA